MGYKRVSHDDRSEACQPWVDATSDHSLIRPLPLARATWRSRRSVQLDGPRRLRRPAVHVAVHVDGNEVSITRRDRTGNRIAKVCATQTPYIVAHTCSVTRGPAVAAIPDISIDAAAVRDRPRAATSSRMMTIGTRTMSDARICVRGDPKLAYNRRRSLSRNDIEQRASEVFWLSCNPFTVKATSISDPFYL